MMKANRKSGNISWALSIAVSTVLIVGFSTRVEAEYQVERSGDFAVTLPTPECDDVFDALEDIGDVVWDGVEYLGEAQLDVLEGVGHLAMGDPGPLVDRVNKSFDDLGTAAAAVSDYSPLALASLVVEVLPAGEVTDFLRSGTELSDQLRRQVIEGAVSGLNPIQTADTVLNDLEEIGGDLVNVLKNLDDPASFGNEFLKFQQKWSGAGALTYMLTEGDPMVGMQKALQALHRQVEIVTTYGGGPKGDVAQALLGVVMDETDNFIKNMNDPKQKKAAAALAATFATSFANTLADPNRVAETSSHPFYKAHLRNVEREWLGDAHNDGGEHNWGLFHPKVEDQPGCISLGDYAYGSYGGPDAKPTLKAVCGVESGRNKWWSRPVDYKLIWGDNCSGATHDRSIWIPICPTGFVSVGFVAWKNSSQKPLPNRIACLKDDLSLLNVVDGQQAGLTWIANDKGSGAKYDVTIYTRIFAGMNLMYATNRDRPHTDPEFLNARVAVSWGEPSPTGIVWTDTAGYPTGGPPGTASQRLPDGEYTIQHMSNQRFLDAYEDDNNNQVVTRKPQTDRSQVWVLSNQGGDIYRMQQKSNMRFLDAYADSDGEAVTRNIQYDKTQLWIVKQAPGAYPGVFSIQHAFNQRYLDAYEDGGYSVVTRGDQNNASQQWMITMTPESRAAAQRREAEAARQREARAVRQREAEAAQLRAAQEAAATSAQPAAAPASQPTAEAPVQQSLVLTGTPTYTHQVFSNRTPDKNFYITAADEFVWLSGGRNWLLGRVVASADNRFVAVIEETEGGRLGVDVNGDYWRIDIDDNSLQHAGRIQALQDSAAQASGENRQTPPPQAAAATSQQQLVVVSGTPTYTHQLFSNLHPQNSFYITAADELVLLTPVGQNLLIGRVLASSDNRFAAMIEQVDGSRLGVDAKGDYWRIDATDNSLQHGGRIQALQDAAAQGSGSNQNTPPQQAAETYVYQLFDNEDPQGSEGSYYITSAGRVVGVTPQGNVQHLGTTSQSQNDSFVLMLQMSDGSTAGIDNQGIIWNWDQDIGSWQQAGTVQDAQ